MKNGTLRNRKYI